MFDAVLIHDAVSYMLTEDDLQAAFATARRSPPSRRCAARRAGPRDGTTLEDGMVLKWPIRPPSAPDGNQGDGRGD